MAIPSAAMDEFLAARELRRSGSSSSGAALQAAHARRRKEEKLLAMQTEMAEAANQIFRQLNDADLKFGNRQERRGRSGRAEPRLVLGASCTCAQAQRAARRFINTTRNIRTTPTRWRPRLPARCSATFTMPRRASYTSALEAALFPDKVPMAVYDNLIESVHRHLPALYRYYDLRRRKMKLDDIHHYDTYVPILSELQAQHTWDQAVEVVIRSLEPLGSDYCGDAGKGAQRPLVRSLSRTRASRAGPSARARSTAIRTS